MKLLRSRIETLRAVELLGNVATPERVSRHLGLERVSGEARLLELRKAGLIHPVYHLTEAGQAALSTGGSK